MKNKKKLIIVTILLFLAACGHAAPLSVINSCEMLDDKDSWYKAAKKTEKKYGTPIYVQLAIIRQESSFKYNAKTKRKYFLWIIPWGRESSAYGYAQVKDDTWDWYKKRTGNSGADRDNFKDAVDFIGWYTDVSKKTLGISKWDAYNQYLAYHEGHSGYKNKSYLKKKWLMGVAKKVEGYSKIYAAQLKTCEDDLGGWSFWPFR
jgi:hypothetical protein